MSGVQPKQGSLWAHVPREVTEDADVLLDAFLGWVNERGLSLYPAQEEAILELLSDRHVVLVTPTGSGKSLVATAMLFRTLAGGRRAFYTCPIKALVSEKFFELCEVFGAEHVGMMTGDASINATRRSSAARLRSCRTSRCAKATPPTSRTS